MGHNYIILDLEKLKIITTWNKPKIFDSYMEAFKYGEIKVKTFKLIKL